MHKKDKAIVQKYFCEHIGETRFLNEWIEGANRALSPNRRLCRLQMTRLMHVFKRKGLFDIATTGRSRLYTFLSA